MKKLVLIATLFLSGCIATLSEQQAMVMPAGDLCTFEMNYGYSDVAQNAILARNLNCEKVIIEDSKAIIPTLNTAELCNAESRNPIPAVYPLIQKEIAKRNLDCLSFMQTQHQMAITQQQAISQQQYQAEMLRLQQERERSEANQRFLENATVGQRNRNGTRCVTTPNGFGGMVTQCD